MIVAGTGHRPDKLTLADPILGTQSGYSSHVTTLLEAFAVRCLRRLRPECVISGMAQGWDQALARAAVCLAVPFDAYVPFEGQEARWPRRAQLEYQGLLRRARKIRVCCPGAYAGWKMQKRNEMMVDAADVVLALWNGTSGGTANCIRYAETTKKVIHQVWEPWTHYGLQTGR